MRKSTRFFEKLGERLVLKTPQVLDDSTDEDIRRSVQECVQEWVERGVDVRYRTRQDRAGFKAGNLREGMKEAYAQSCDFVAILDADFEPSPSWLCQTVPHLEVLPLSSVFLNLVRDISQSLS